MNMLLTSAGMTNASITAALEDLLGKPVSQSRALVVMVATARSNFAILPHADNVQMPDNSMANLEIEAAELPVPSYRSTMRRRSW